MKCLHCQTELLGKYQTKFCSRSCSASANNVGVRRHPEAEIKLCRTCGGVTTRPIYCSDACNPKRLQLTPEQKKLRHKAMHNEAWQRYQAKLRNQTPSDVDVKELQRFYLNCPDGHEVDHIYPISKGGLHCLENLQYLTISDNRKKSNKVL